MTKEEAIKELRSFVGQLTEGCQDVIKVLIPELVESEDERIREWLIDTIKAVPNDSIEWDVIEKSCVLAYLEKQKEPIEGKGNSEEIPSNVDLEKEVSKWWDASFPEPDFKFRKHRAHIVSNDEIIHLARHFYELGLKAKRDVDLGNYISNKLRELGADLINHKPYSFNRGLNVGEGNAYQDILDRLNARKEK